MRDVIKNGCFLLYDFSFTCVTKIEESKNY